MIRTNRLRLKCTPGYGSPRFLIREIHHGYLLPHELRKKFYETRPSKYPLQDDLPKHDKGIKVDQQKTFEFSSFVRLEEEASSKILECCDSRFYGGFVHCI